MTSWSAFILAHQQFSQEESWRDAKVIATMNDRTKPVEHKR